MSPAVSIILPTFNRLQFLPAAVASVLEQTFQDWELLIADDGSGADTRAYLHTLHDPPRVRVLWLSHTGRPAVVRNAALRGARGEYVAFLDSDDLWLPEKLQTQMASLSRQPARRWSHTKFVLVDESGQPTAWARAGGWPAPQGWIRDQLVKGETVIALPSVLVSRGFVEQVGGFDEQLVMCEDYELWLRLAVQSEIDAIDESLTLVRRHAEHSGNDVTALQDSERVIGKVLRAGGVEHLHSILRRQRAEIATGLARSHAAGGNRLSALRALLSSAEYSWRYPQWWLGALQATARAVAPQAVWQVARRYRNSRQAQGGVRP
jgi:glycosyltransferase involved in cell wall biosynthesis